MKFLMTFSFYFLISSSIFAGQAPSGPLLAAPSLIETSNTSVAAKYHDLNQIIESQISNGPALLSALFTFDTSVSEGINTAIFEALRPILTFEYLEGALGQPGFEWILPLYQYAQGDETGEPQIYEVVNHELRTKSTHSTKTIEWVGAMRASMERLPRFVGLSFRGTRLTPDRIERYYPLGGEAVDKAFISSSVYVHVASKFANPKTVMDEAQAAKEKVSVFIIIKGRTGRPVSAFALQHAHENEILFANGTKMNVIAKSPIFRDAIFENTQIILLEER